MKRKALTYNGIIIDPASLEVGIYPDSFPRLYPMSLEDERIKDSIHSKYKPKGNQLQLSTFISNLSKCTIEIFELVNTTHNKPHDQTNN